MRVLIVDDNSMDRELLRAVIEPQGHSLTEAGDGLEALDVLEREKIDAIISDVLMPRMDGQRLCLELRNSDKFKAIPFIFYTSTYTLPSDKQAAMELGADKFLRKPLPAKEIIQALEEAVQNAPHRRPETSRPLQELDLMRQYNQRLVGMLEEEHRKLQEETEALQSTQQRLAHVLGLSQAVIYSLKPVGKEFTLAWISENVVQLLGFEHVETSQPEWWSTNLHPADRDKVTAGRMRLLKESRVALEYRFRRKDGKYRWLRDEQRLVWGAGGEPAEIVGTAIDITDYKELEERLVQSQKMEAIGRLAGGVAHDFNNLLAVIGGNVELALMDAGRLSKESGECLKQATETVQRAAGLTRQLLAFGRMQVMQPQPVALNDVIGNLTKMLERIIGEDIELHCRCEKGLPFIQADAGMMDQVLVNLIVNARDAMPQGGEVLIAAETVTLDKAYAQANPEARAGEFVVLSVSDSGTGISPEHLSHIFEPFFSTKEAGKGTGLGLATVHGIVKQHQGWVEVSSQLGAGSTFRILLPAITSRAAPARKAPSQERAVEGGETILLVEDEEAVRSAIRRLLEKFGYRIREATSGREALEIWRDKRAEIDLVLTDVIMPQGVNGPELVKTLQAERPDLRVIFMSGYSGQSPNEQTGLVLRKKGRFLQKPCSCHELLTTVRQCLDTELQPQD